MRPPCDSIGHCIQAENRHRRLQLELDITSGEATREWGHGGRVQTPLVSGPLLYYYSLQELRGLSSADQNALKWTNFNVKFREFSRGSVPYLTQNPKPSSVSAVKPMASLLDLAFMKNSPILVSF